MKISEHFTLDELTRTHTGYPNVPGDEAVGGARASAHLDGRACDFHPIGDTLIREHFERIARSKIPYDRMILEFKNWKHWIHVEVPRGDAAARQLCYQGLEVDGVMQFREVRYAKA